MKNKHNLLLRSLRKQGYRIVYLYEEKKSIKLQTLAWCEKKLFHFLINVKIISEFNSFYNKTQFSMVSLV